MSAKRNALVLAGNEVKLRLEAERIETKTPVHIDWLRFTVQRRNILPSLDLLFPEPKTALVYDETSRLQFFLREIAKLPDCDNDAAAQAMELAQDIAAILGPDFVVNPAPKKGQDFYKLRLAIERNGAEVAWVGFMASSDSPRQRAQAMTVHANIHGAACTFAAPGWNQRMADLVDERNADITRCDLALDFFDGLPGGIERVRTDYIAGLCDSGGKRLKCNQLGDWANTGDRQTSGRSFYFGSKEAGKQTNAYEKGHQLYGIEHGSAWTRIELRYGNKLRDLQTDMLRRPADYFAGASEWHLSMLHLAGELEPIPEPVRCRGRQAAETVKAEVARIKRWFSNTAQPALAILMRHTTEDEMHALCTPTHNPGRLRRFTDWEIGQAFDSLRDSFTLPEGAGRSFAMA